MSSLTFLVLGTFGDSPGYPHLWVPQGFQALVLRVLILVTRPPMGSLRFFGLGSLGVGPSDPLPLVPRGSLALTPRVMILVTRPLGSLMFRGLDCLVVGPGETHHCIPPSVLVSRLLVMTRPSRFVQVPWPWFLVRWSC